MQQTKQEFNHASNSANYAKPLLCETLGATSNVAKNKLLSMYLLWFANAQNFNELRRS